MSEDRAARRLSFVIMDPMMALSITLARPALMGRLSPRQPQRGLDRALPRAPPRALGILPRETPQAASRGAQVRRRSCEARNTGGASRAWASGREDCG